MMMVTVTIRMMLNTDNGGSNNELPKICKMVRHIVLLYYCILVPICHVGTCMLTKV